MWFPQNPSVGTKAKPCPYRKSFRIAITATIATFFVGQDANDNDGEIASEKSVQALQAEIAALRKEIQENRAVETASTQTKSA